MGSEGYVRGNIDERPNDLYPCAGSYLIESNPCGQVFLILLLHYCFTNQNISIVVARLPHHSKHIAGVMRRVRIVFCIGMRMVHTVHNAIGIGTDVGSALGKETTDKKST